MPKAAGPRSRRRKPVSADLSKAFETGAKVGSGKMAVTKRSWKRSRRFISQTRSSDNLARQLACMKKARAAGVMVPPIKRIDRRNGFIEFGDVGRNLLETCLSMFPLGQGKNGRLSEEQARSSPGG